MSKAKIEREHKWLIPKCPGKFYQYKYHRTTNPATGTFYPDILPPGIKKGDKDHRSSFDYKERKIIQTYLCPWLDDPSDFSGPVRRVRMEIEAGNVSYTMTTKTHIAPGENEEEEEVITKERYLGKYLYLQHPFTRNIVKIRRTFEIDGRVWEMDEILSPEFNGWGILECEVPSLDEEIEPFFFGTRKCGISNLSIALDPVGREFYDAYRREKETKCS